MIDPISALLVASALIAVVLILLWPNWGVIWQLQRGRQSTEKVLLEDALKHLYHQEYRNRKGTLESLSGALGISRDRVFKLLARLESLGLIESHDNEFELTSEGSSYALRIIRVHRLWEKYFADETGLAETEWHEEAERLEHKTSLEEAEALATQMGNPPHDPHGDPIPTSTGELPPRKGQPLTDFPVDELAGIIHLEDEPAALYAQLVAEGLHPGMQIRIIDKSGERIKFIADGEEIVLAPVVAANITVVPIPVEQEMAVPHEALSSLGIGESATVIGISNACRGLQRRRLMDLGIIPGTVVSAEMKSASGNPTAYNIRGATIALRNEQANMIHIRRKEAA